MKFEIITIGDELLIGQVINTNAAWMGSELKSRGWDTVQVSVVPDQLDAIVTAFTLAFTRADVVLVSGGIGPTKDDVTKRALSQFYQTHLQHDESVLQNIQTLFAHRSLLLNELTRQQALVPAVAQIIQNKVGTAPCCWFEEYSKILVSLPGVPSEMKWLMSHEVLPRLEAKDADQAHILTHVLMVKDYTESGLAEHLADIEEQLPNGFSLAYLPQPSIVRLRLTAKGKDLIALEGNLQKQIELFRQRLQQAIFAEKDLPLACLVMERLKERSLLLSTAESCTGGRIASMITAIAGSSEVYTGSVVSYANEVKMGLLHVSETDLQQHGAVSEPVVRQMAQGVAQACMSSCAVATSGIAGPSGGTPEKPVGTVWIAAYVEGKTHARCFQFGTSREYNIQKAANEALLMLLSML